MNYQSWTTLLLILMCFSNAPSEEKTVASIPVSTSPLEGHQDMSVSTNKMIHQLMAKSRINELEQSMDEVNVKAECIALGERYNLVSKYTSFVAVNYLEGNQTGVNPIANREPILQDLEDESFELHSMVPVLCRGSSLDTLQKQSVSLSDSFATMSAQPKKSKGIFSGWGSAISSFFSMKSKPKKDVIVPELTSHMSMSAAPGPFKRTRGKKKSGKKLTRRLMKSVPSEGNTMAASLRPMSAVSYGKEINISSLDHYAEDTANLSRCMVRAASYSEDEDSEELLSGLMHDEAEYVEYGLAMPEQGSSLQDDFMDEIEELSLQNESMDDGFGFPQIETHKQNIVMKAPISYSTLIQAQNFNGSFNLDLTTLNVNGMNEIQVEYSLDAVVLNTLVAIWLFMHRFADKQHEWVLMVKKAKTFVFAHSTITADTLDACLNKLN